jgi:chorismate dehydratase
MRIRVGAVSYLNARPLVRGLGRSPERFDVRYDLPSNCAALLHAGEIDLGLIPSIEYLGGDYRVVPGVGVVSDGAVASVAIFTRVPIGDIRSLALDTSSRTSVALIKVLCARHFRVTPAFVSAGPDLAAMVAVADAALLIGEPALLAEYERHGLRKIDLGEAWKAMTGLPFVYAFWAGAPGVLTPADVRALQQARDEGRRDSDEVAAEYFAAQPDRQGFGASYLRQHIRYHVGERERAALDLFFTMAAEIAAAPRARPICFYEEAETGTNAATPEAAGARRLLGH